MCPSPTFEPPMGSCLSKSESSVREEMMITSSSAAEDDLRRSYVVGDEIGRGGFGVVYSCTSSATGKTLAIKSVGKTLAIFSDLMETVAACHRRGVAHRDIKPENILFDADGRARLADFGSAGCFGEGREMSGLVGTLYYVAPEVVAEKELRGRWMCGAPAQYCMLCSTGRCRSFNGKTDQEVFKAVLKGNLRFPTRLFRDVSPAAKDLMRRMMCKDVSRRFTGPIKC